LPAAGLTCQCIFDSIVCAEEGSDQCVRVMPPPALQLL